MGDKPIFELGPLADSDGPDIGLDDQAPTARAARDLQQVRPRTQAASDKRVGLLLALTAIVIAVGALIAVPLLTGNDAATDAEPALPEDLSGDGAAVADGSGIAGSEAVSAGAGFEPPSTGHLRADEVAWLFQNEINRDGNRYGVAYVAGDDFVVLDHRGITLPQLDIAVDFATVSNLALLTTNGRTWAVNPADRERNYLVSNSYVVIVSERPGTIATIRPNNPTDIGLMSSALPVPSVELPEGAALLWAQGRGPLVMPRTGGTFEVSGIASSLTRISDDSAVAASLRGTIYESCDDSLSCTYFSQVGDGPLRQLPFSAGVDFSISPDGAWLVASTDAALVVYDLTARVEVTKLEQGLTSVDWSPDSSFVAIVEGDVLLVLEPETAETTSLRLNQTPDKGSLLVFEG